jgi:hypothetical protein
MSWFLKMCNSLEYFKQRNKLQTPKITHVQQLQIVATFIDLLMEKNLCAQNALITFNGKMEQTCPTKHTSCAYEKKNVLRWEPELISALAGEKMWLLKGCTLKVK